MSLQVPSVNRDDDDDDDDGVVSPTTSVSTTSTNNQQYRHRARTQVFQTPPPLSAAAAITSSATPTRREQLTSQFQDAQAKLRRLQLLTQASARGKQQRKTATLTRKDANIAEKLSQELEEAYQELHSKEENLKLAAELGSQLVGTVEEQSQLLNTLEEESRATNAEMQLLRDERNRLRKDLGRMQVQLDEVHAECEEVKQRRDELDEVVGRLRRKEDDKVAAERGKTVKAEKELKLAQDEIRSLMRQNATLSDENRTFHDRTSASKTLKVNHELAATLALEWQSRVQNLEHTVAEKDAQIEQLKQQQASPAPATATTTANKQQPQQPQQQQQHHRRKKTEPMVATYEDYNKYRLTNVPAEIPPEALVTRAMNLFNAMIVIALSLSVMVGAIDTNIPVTMCLATMCIGVMWMIFEGHPSRLETTFQRYVSFFYTIVGRVLFVGVVVMMTVSMGTIGIPVAVYTGITLIGTVYVLHTFPDLRDRHMKVALINRNISTRNLHARHHLQQPLLMNDDEEVGVGVGIGVGVGVDSDPLLAGAQYTAIESDSGLARQPIMIMNDRVGGGGGLFPDHHTPAARRFMSDEDDDGVDWEENVDSTTGRVYYLNTKTGDTSFTKPSSSSL